MAHTSAVPPAIGSDPGLLGDVLSAAPLGVAVAERGSDAILYFNERFCAIWGIAPLEARLARGELRFSDVMAYCAVRAREPAALMRQFQQLQDTQDSADVDCEIELSDGQTLRCISRPTRRDESGPNARFYLFEDITEYRVAERGFAESERRLSTFIEGVQEYALYLLDLDGRVTSWNAGAEKMKGYSAAEVVGESFARFYTLEDIEQGMPERSLRAARQTGRFAHEGWRVRKDGSRFWGETVINAVHDEAGQIIGFAKITRDMTSRKLAEEALKLSEARLRAVMDGAVDGLITIDQDGIIQLFSAPAERIFGYSAREVIGRNVRMLMPEPYHSQHDRYVHNYLSTGIRKIIGIGREVEGQRKDGTVFPMDLAVGELPPDSGRREFVGSVRDITERKVLERQLQQAQKMEAVGQLTGGVAHDFNNLLAVILGNLEIVREKFDQQELVAPIDTALRATQRGAELTQRLLAFSRRQMLRPEIIDVNRLVTGMVGLLDRTLGETIQMKIALDEQPWVTRVDPGQLENSLLNLALNARDAMLDGGTLTIETSKVTLDAQYAERSPDVTAGQYVLLAVSDTGSGMPLEVVTRAFEPFFTTKETGKGSGLGLSMVYGFVKQSGGHVNIYSEVGRGTTVKIYLPRIRGEAGQAFDPVAAPEPRGQGEVILVVEDDSDVRALATFLLRELGYAVLAAEDAHKGMQLLVEHAETDLLLTDVVLPRGMSGAELAERARAARPELPIVFMSGYTANTAIQSGLADEQDRLINKPFRKLELARKIRQALDARKQA